MTFQVKLKKDSGHPEGGENQGDAVITDSGQTITPEMFKDMLSNFGVTISDAVQNAARPPEPKSVEPIHQQLGLSETQATTLKESLGDQAYESVMGTLGGIIDKSQKNDLLLAQHLEKMSQEITAKFQEQTDAIKKIDVNPVNEAQIRELYGFTEYFNEDNHDDLVEHLSSVTENSGGLLDAVSDYNRAEREKDYTALRKYKESFESFMQDKYKDHGSIIGSNGNSIRADVTKTQEDSNTIETLQGEQDKLISEKKFAEAHAKGEEIKAILG